MGSIRCAVASLSGLWGVGWYPYGLERFVALYGVPVKCGIWSHGLTARVGVSCLQPIVSGVRCAFTCTGHYLTTNEDTMRKNIATEEGCALGKEMARLCDGQFAGKADPRCQTCAFRHGDHLANGSAETLMSALKCAMEGTPFYCHEHEKACAGWSAMCFPADKRVEAPWEHVEGVDV